MGRAIGIDLGTTNSCAAAIEDGKPQVITYRDGQKTIPSVFAIDKEGNRLVGNEAKVQAAANAANTVMASKRLIGRSFGGQATEKMKQVFTYELVEGESSEVLIKVKDQVFTLEQISAAILRRIKEAAEDALDEEVDQAVITVPAYFNDRQRQAVRSAGKLAGLKVLRVLNEPTAAALAYGLGRTLNQRVAIYDLGGGTFDISIIDIKDKIFEVIATGGDTFLGGVDFDDRLMQYVMQQFLADTGIDLSYDRSAVTKIRDAAENAKIALSSVDVTRITVENVAEDEDGAELDLVLDVSRDLLERLTVELVDRSIETCERILGEAGTTKDGVDEILLVGGQSRMPLVRRKLADFIGRAPSQKVHPDEAVAIGAAIMAHSLSARSGGHGVTLLDVLPQPIGIAGKGGAMHVLFKKNQPLPDYKQRTLTTSRDDQRSIMLRVYQGESDLVADNELLGTFHFYNIRAAPAKAVKVSVTFHIDSEGILNLTAVDKESGQTVESRLNLGKVDEAPKRKRKKKAEPQAPAPPPMPLNMPTTSSLQQANPLTAGSDATTSAPPQPTGPAPLVTPESALKPAGSTPAPNNRLLAPAEEKKGFFARLLAMLFFWRK